MRSLRLLLGGVALAAALTIAGCGAARANAAGVWIQVSPGTIQAGNNVTVSADCGDNSNPAKATSKAFAPLLLRPWNTVLQAQVRIASTVPAGTFEVLLTCKTGSTATTTLTVLSGPARQPGAQRSPAAPTLGPHTGGGFLARSATKDSEAARLWLIGGVTALLVGGTVTIVSLRRRPAGRARRRGRLPSRR